MLILKNLSKQINLLSKCLKNGGTICFPTETVSALACDATIPIAVDKIYKMKNRNRKKYLSILVPDIKTAKKYVLVDTRAFSLIKKFSPGAITYILPNKNLSGWPDSIGIRIPDHPIAQFILQHYPDPLVGTSVNISGETSAKTVDEIPEKIKDAVDIIVTDDSKGHSSGVPSTIVDLSVPGKNKIIRQGKISKKEIDEIYYATD